MLRLFFFYLVFPFCNFIFSQSTDSRYTKTLNDSVFSVGDIILVTCIDYSNGAPLNSKDSVNRLISFFEQNPYIIVEISVHSDARGNADLNQDLCLVRSQVLIQIILESDSLFSERFIPVGKGESDPIYSEEFINQHLDDPTLVEQYHKTNRRTEIKIIGFINKDFYNNQRAATGVEEVVYLGSNYDNLLFVADKALLDGDHQKAMEFYLRASAVAPANDNYAMEQYKKLVLLNE